MKIGRKKLENIAILLRIEQIEKNVEKLLYEKERLREEINYDKRQKYS